LDGSTSRDAALAQMRRLDGDVTGIRASAPHAALYSFDTAERRWVRGTAGAEEGAEAHFDARDLRRAGATEQAGVWGSRACAQTKCEKEGPLFVAARSSEPRRRLFLLNRLSRANFAVDLLATTECEVRPPYLLFRDRAKKDEVAYGLWFPQEAALREFEGSLRTAIRSVRLNQFSDEEDSERDVVGGRGGIAAAGTRGGSDSAGAEILSVLGAGGGGGAPSSALRSPPLAGTSTGPLFHTPGGPGSGLPMWSSPGVPTPPVHSSAVGEHAAREAMRDALLHLIRTDDALVDAIRREVARRGTA
jgi:hypothetical protein